VKPQVSAILLGVCALGLMFVPNSRALEEKHPPGGIPGKEQAEGDEGDSEFEEMLEAHDAIFGLPNGEIVTLWDEIRAREAERWADLLPGGGSQGGLSRAALFRRNASKHSSIVAGAINPKDSTAPWLNIGPTDVLVQNNGATYEKFDSGRPVAVVADPRDPNVVYNATSNGGVWKTSNFVGGYPNPTWAPITDGLPGLSVGTFGIDPTNPDTLYMVTGDAFDIRTAASVYKSTDAGATWAAPVTLLAPYPGISTPFRPVSARDIQVDEKNSNLVMVATVGGLFRSTDGGSSFAWVDLPNGTVAAAEQVWNVLHLGGTNWIASGQTACSAFPEAGSPFAVQNIPTVRGIGSAPSPTCVLGNLGDIWRSTDSGLTWQSTRYPATGLSALPSLPSTSVPTRISLAAGKTSDPNRTTVYAYVGGLERPDGEPTYTSKTLAFWRTRTSGVDWADATGALANPTIADPSCSDMNLAHNQSWYNQAIAVDPTNDDNVIAGGNLCSIRTLNGTSTSPKWENVSFWLTVYEGAYTFQGKLSYAHADWQTASVVIVNGKPLALVGNDGGVYSSRNVFEPNVTPPNVVWNGSNRGLVTHLAYSVGSGDPTAGNGYLAIMGLQDNGTWIRPTALGRDLASGKPAFLELLPTTFTGVVGGDGIGSVVSNGTLAELWFVSVAGGYLVCDNAHTDCSSGSNYFSAAPVPRAERPFFVYYAQVPTDPTGLSTLTNSTTRVFRSSVELAKNPEDAGLADAHDASTDSSIEEGSSGEVFPSANSPVVTATNLTWKQVSPDFAGQSLTVTKPIAARFLPNVIGAVFGPSPSNGPVAVTTTGGSSNLADWTIAAQLPADAANRRQTSASYMDFPNAVAEGLSAGDEFVISTSRVFMSDGFTPVPDSNGRVFRTTDRGKTWTNICGQGGPSPLPNVPVYMIKYDPSDTTSKTLYAATLIGVYATTNGGVTWSRYGRGLPFVQVNEIFIPRNSEFLRIATYGRGLWEIYPSAQANRGVSGNGDYDLNQHINWIDLAAVASRLGTTPATNEEPRYNSICDINSPPITPTTERVTASIKDADLSTVLEHFAGHP
jgi:hypothetical protein